MSAADGRMVRFLRRHHVLTLATEEGGAPHCSSLFYAYDAAQNRFVVTSEAKTLHVRQLLKNSRVGGVVALESRVVGKLQGVQFRGRMTRPEGAEMAEARKIYLERFPFAVFLDLDLWVIEPEWMKMTDNRLGFGKKLTWERCTDVGSILVEKSEKTKP